MGIDYSGLDATLCPQQKGEKPAPGRVGIKAAADGIVTALDTRAENLGDRFQVGEFGFIFIDGDHSYEGVKRDTENALRLVRQEGCIVWHNYYESLPWVGVRPYVSGPARDREIVAIQGTWLGILKFGVLKLGLG